MTIHDCHCSYHFGDCVIALRLIYHLAQRHPERVWRMAVHRCHLPELQPLVDHQPNITLCDIETFGIQSGSINLWKQDQEFWSTHPLKNDFAAFTKRYFRRLTRKFGLNDPTPGLLFDFPCLNKFLRSDEQPEVLFINSAPCSGQFMDYSHDNALDEMAHALARKNKVWTTKPVDGIQCTDFPGGRMDCFQIGILANGCKAVVGVSTGPSWLTMNVFSKPAYRLLMIGNGEHVDLTDDTVNCKTIAQAMDELKRVGLI